MAGVINYVMKQIKQQQYIPVFTLTLPLFLLIVAGFEIWYRLQSQTGVLDFSKVKTDNVMTIDEFHDWVKAGKRLVTIDNLVLDYGNFAMIHPGGKFALQRTVGRDISKYFYGGFHILSDKGVHAPHLHTLKAFEIAKRMVVARIKG